MNSKAITAPRDYVDDFVRCIEMLSPRHIGRVDISYADFYYSKNVDPLDGARLYVLHRPKGAQ
jgi:hypothetical protein